MTRLRDGQRFIDRPLAIIDIETTGSEPHHPGPDGLCRLGTPNAINRRCGEITEIACLIVNPKTFEADREFSFKAQVVNHHGRPELVQNFEGYNRYTQADWVDAIPLAEVIQQFALLTTGAVPCAWGANFERLFIEHASTQTGKELRLDHHWTCIMSFALGLFRAGRIHSLEMETAFSLETVADCLGLRGEPKPHTAIGGVKLELQVFLSLLQLAAA